MTDREIETTVKDRIFRLTADWANWRWHTGDQLAEANFPLILYRRRLRNAQLIVAAKAVELRA